MKLQRLMKLAGCVLAMAMMAQATTANAEPVRVLILSGANVHDWKATTPFIEKMYADSGRFKVVETVNNVSQITASTFAQCDVVVSNWTCHPVMTGGPWTADGKKALAEAINSSKGMVQFHAACSACNDWPEFQEISGLTWKWAYTNHTAYHTFKVVNRDTSHPITKGVPDFWINDELYQKMAKMGKSDFHLLMNAFAEPFFGGIGAWEPMLITTQMGKGRGVNFLLGHDVHAMQNIAWQTVMLRATEWAATGKVTMPIPEDWPSTAAAADTVGVDVDLTLKAAAAYAFGQARQPLAVVEQLVICSTSRTGDKAVADRAQLAAKLATMIPGCKTPEGKGFFCSQLARVGTPDQVPAIAPLLVDEETSMMARFALERITGSASAKALRDALANLKGKPRIGVVDSLGDKADPDAVTVLAPLVKDVDAALAAAAIAALGKIGTPEAAAVLRDAREHATDAVRPAVRDACLNCAERLVANGNPRAAASIYELLYNTSESGQTRAAGLRGLVLTQPGNATKLLREALESKVPELHAMAAYIVRNLPEAGDTKEIGKCIARLSLDLQRLMLIALGDRGDKAAAAVARDALTSDTESVRIAAITALARLGDETDVPRLFNCAKGSEADRTAVRAVLVAMRGEGTENAIAELVQTGDPKIRDECAAILVGRNASGTILKMLAHAAEKKNAGIQIPLIRVLSQIGDDRALAAASAATKTESAEVRQAALATLAAWPSPVAFNDLLKVVRDKDNAAQRPVIMQALLRLLPAVIEHRPSEVASLIDAVMQSAGRVEDKRAALEILGKQRTPAAMQSAMQYLNDASVADAAGMAAAKVALTLDDSHRDEIKKAMQEIIGVCKSADTVKAADAMLRKASQPINLARSAQASSPDDIESDGAASGDQAAIDGDPNTYWDEVNGQKVYILRLAWKQPVRCSTITIKGHAFESFCPKDFDIVGDDKVVKTVRNAVYDRQNVSASFAFPGTTCTSLELRITGYYGDSPGIRELEVYDEGDSGSASTLPSTISGPASYTWQQTASAVALLNHDRPVWQFNYARTQAKPYFNPLNLPDGTELVWLSPPDHPWHHALWFAWKELNGINYWETGNMPGGGFTEVIDSKVATHPDFSARIELAISYHPAEKPAVLTEKRVISVSPPGADGSYHIDWTGAFTAGGEDVHMKGGTAGGGYAGLSVRISKNSRGWELLDSEHRRDLPTGGVTRNTHGQKSRWTDFSLVGATTGTTAGITIFDHPANLRFPSQWHDVMDDRIPFGYFSPAPLWSEPYTLPAGKDLTLRYRILVHSGRRAPARLEEEFQTFIVAKQAN